MANPLAHVMATRTTAGTDAIIKEKEKLVLELEKLRVDLEIAEDTQVRGWVVLTSAIFCARGVIAEHASWVAANTQSVADLLNSLHLDDVTPPIGCGSTQFSSP
jgi:hypothetical protein